MGEKNEKKMDEEEVKSREWAVYVGIIILSIIAASEVGESQEVTHNNDADLLRTSVVPLIYILIMSFFIVGLEAIVLPHRRRFQGALRIWLGLWFASLYTFCVTRFLKVYIHQPRPDFDLQGYPLHVTLEDYTMNHSSKYANKGLFSSLSSHSPSAMAVSIFVALRVVVLAHLSHTYGFFFRAQALFFCSIFFVFVGFVIGCPRIVDIWHVPVEVTAAFFVGLVCSLYYALPLISHD